MTFDQVVDRIGDRIVAILEEKGQGLGIDRDLAVSIVAERRELWSAAAASTVPVVNAAAPMPRTFFLVCTYDEAGERRFVTVLTPLDPSDEANHLNIAGGIEAQYGVRLKSFVAVDVQEVLDYVVNVAPETGTTFH